MTSLTNAALPMVHSNFGAVRVMVSTYLPFIILPRCANLEQADPTLDEAAMDLGFHPCSPIS